MSKKLNHIDQIARHKLLDAEVEIPASAWERLQKDMDKTNSKKRILLFTRLATSAALIILFLGLGLKYLAPTKTENQIADKQNLTDSSTNRINKIALRDNFKVTQNEATISIAIKERELPKPLSIFREEIKIARLTLLDFTYPITSNGQQLTLIDHNNLIKIDDFDWSKYEYSDEKALLAENKNDWKIGFGYSPSYASRSQNTDLAFDAGPQDNYYPELSNVSEKLVPSLTFGANFAYSLSDRWSVISGVYYLNQKNEIQNFRVFENTTNNTSRFSSNSSLGNIHFKNSEVIFSNANFVNKIGLGMNNNVSNFASDLIQEFEFIEIPLLISYKLINTRLTISLVTGLNTGFLVANSVYIKDYKSEKVGNTEDVNALTFKSVFGLSFEYPISKRLFLNISPTYKYQLNNLNKVSASNYHLKFFDVKTGISYHF